MYVTLIKWFAEDACLRSKISYLVFGNVRLHTITCEYVLQLISLHKFRSIWVSLHLGWSEDVCSAASGATTQSLVS